MVVAAGVAVAVSVAGVAVVAAAADYVENDLDVLTEVESKYPPNKFLWFRAQSYGLFPPLCVWLISISKIQTYAASQIQLEIAFTTQVVLLKVTNTFPT